ncbi:unnamed protein product [Rhizophagus irregularis]|uniref:HAT C-terminal dimerisation domain-containing protein n=3 Tax=Rhizophagus irregularis TaxID=588596 RepID=A0A915ZJH8_9GLOM|nr:unnamed protein product [Rhizophagus irregularis]
MSDSLPSNSKKTKSANSTNGRPKKPIWRFFEQGDEIDKGHYIATCLACKQTFRPGKTPVMEKHIMNNCSKVDHSIREAVIYMVEARETREISSNANTKRQNSESDQVTLENFYENSNLSKERKEDIDTALIKAFVIGENSNIITSEAVKTIINRKRGFFNDVYDLANIMKPIRDAILSLESNKSTLADCYFSLACLGQSINKIPDENENVRFRQHAIKSFNERFKMYDFDEYLLAYYIHPSYKGFGVKMSQYQRVQSTAARIWQQMLKDPNIATYLKKHDHSKKKSAEILLAQIGEFHLQTAPYNMPYSSQVNTPLSWWKMCVPTPPYLQLLSIKLFSIIPHAASCERIWSICGWMVGKRRTRLLTENLESMSKIHSYYIANSKSELPNFSKDRTAEELRTILSDAHLCDDDDEYVDDYNEEEMIKLVSSPPINDDCEQVPSQDLEILNVLDLDSMFKDKSNNITDKQLELDGLNDFIQELDEEDDFDPDLLVQNFNS